MASVSASHLILFIASMVIAASVAGVFTDTVGRLGQAISDQGLDVSENVRTDVEIISDAGSDAVYNDSTGNITLYVKNTGSETLPARADRMDLFVDGIFETNVEATLLEDGVQWRPGGVVRLDIAHSLDPDTDHRVKLIVNADEEVFKFRS